MENNTKIPYPDLQFLIVAKKSPAYRWIHDRLFSPFPQDAWTMDGFAFYVFELCPEEGRSYKAGTSPIALFVVDKAQEAVTTVKILIPDESASTARVQEWDRPDLAFVVSLPPSWLEGQW